VARRARPGARRRGGGGGRSGGRGARARAAPAGAALAVGDALGALDSVAAAPAGGRSPCAWPTPAAPLGVSAAGAVARAAVPEAPRLGEIVLLARAGWEARFVAAALEERGWTVRARLAVAPGVAPGAGALPALDTARVAAVVALDSTAAALGPAIGAYVRRGGGLVLAGDAALAAALRPLAAAVPGPLADVRADAPPAGVPVARPLGAARADAVPLAGGGYGAARRRRARGAAGRRGELARAPRARRHRARPGHAPRLLGGGRGRGGVRADVRRGHGHRGRRSGARPRAARHHRGGARPAHPAADAPPGAGRPRSWPPRLPGDAWLLGGALVAVLAEVTSRRLRGAR
jgi:hypothetical protein